MKKYTKNKKKVQMALDTQQPTTTAQPLTIPTVTTAQPLVIPPVTTVQPVIIPSATTTTQSLAIPPATSQSVIIPQILVPKELTTDQKEQFLNKWQTANIDYLPNRQIILNTIYLAKHRAFQNINPYFYSRFLDRLIGLEHVLFLDSLSLDQYSDRTTLQERCRKILEENSNATQEIMLQTTRQTLPIVNTSQPLGFIHSSPFPRQITGYYPNRSLNKPDRLAAFIEAPLTGNLLDIPGLGPASASALEAVGIGTSFQLIGKFLSLKDPGVESVELCDRFFYFLTDTVVSAGFRSSIVQSVAYKCNVMYPGIYDESVYD